jgi:hypothetical protein
MGREALLKLVAFVIAAMLMAAIFATDLRAEPDSRVAISLRYPDDIKSEQLRRNLQYYLAVLDLSPYIFKRKVLVTRSPSNSGKPGDTPIELSTYLVGRGHAQLLTFIHEQAHQLRRIRSYGWERALQAFHRAYPNIPVHSELEVNRGMRQLYDHVGVNWLELQAGKRYLGEDLAYEILCDNEIYPSIYRHVFRFENEIGEIMVRSGVNIEPFQPVAQPYVCP